MKRHAGAFTSILLRLVELWRCEHAASYLAGRARCSPETKKKDVVWFALNDDRPLFAFGGIWTEFRGDRGTKSKPIAGPHLVYGFLTTAPNAVVEPIQANRKSCWVSATWLCTTTSLPELNVIVLSWVVGSKAEMLN